MRCFFAVCFSFMTSLMLASEFMPAQFEVKFEQKVVSLQKKERITSGTLKYRFPSQVSMEITSPESEKMNFVCNQQKSWYYKPPFDKGEKGEVIVENASKKLIAGLFDVLRVGLKSNKNYTVKQNKGMVGVDFLGKTQKDLGIVHVDLYFKEGKSDHISGLTTLDIFYAEQNKKNVSFNFQDLKSEVTFSDKDFIFTIPVNTNITQK